MDCHFLMTILYVYIIYIYTVYIIFSIYNNIYNYMSLNITCIKFTGSSSPWLQKHTSGIAWAYIINVFVSFLWFTHIFLYIIQIPCTFRPLCCMLKLFGIIYIYITGRNLALWIAQIAGFFKFNPNPAQGVQYHMSRVRNHLTKNTPPHNISTFKPDE